MYNNLLVLQSDFGLVDGSVNALVVAIAGSLLLIAYARTQTKDGSLSKD